MLPQTFQISKPTSLIRTLHRRPTTQRRIQKKRTLLQQRQHSPTQQHTTCQYQRLLPRTLRQRTKSNLHTRTQQKRNPKKPNTYTNSQRPLTKSTSHKIHHQSRQRQSPQARPHHNSRNKSHRRRLRPPTQRIQPHTKSRSQSIKRPKPHTNRQQLTATPKRNLYSQKRRRTTHTQIKQPINPSRTQAKHIIQQQTHNLPNQPTSTITYNTIDDITSYYYTATYKSRQTACSSGPPCPTQLRIQLINFTELQRHYQVHHV